jgi:hypothetical protein
VGQLWPTRGKTCAKGADLFVGSYFAEVVEYARCEPFDHPHHCSRCGKRGQSEEQRSDIAARLAAIPQTEERVIVATGRYLGEGFDDSPLETLFLTMPVAWKGTLAQYAGRLHRLHDTKREVIIYDYVDMSVPVLALMAAKRRVGYQTIGYRILRPVICFPISRSHQRHPVRRPQLSPFEVYYVGYFQTSISGRGLGGRGRHARPTRRACPQLSVPARFGLHPHWRESGATRASAPFAGFLSVGHFAAHDRKFSRHFKRIF